MIASHARFWQPERIPRCCLWAPKGPRLLRSYPTQPYQNGLTTRYTHGVHIAGKNLSMAEWTADRWAENGRNSSVVSYYVYLNYPVDKSLSLTYSNGSIYTPSLEEAVLNQDETTGYPDRILTHVPWYSASGSVDAEFVYVGRGQQTDFERLIELGVPLEGKVAVASTGPPPGSTISLSNAMEDVYAPIWDSIGIINETIGDETIVIGNHRDAWIIGGAADPNSGTAITVELAKAFGKLLSQGWRPRRNIVLCSWDAKEYGLVGSTGTRHVVRSISAPPGGHPRGRAKSPD
ncbi:hypothetical protein GGS23DRAFT_593248 [Durotheca rogersii]|uniref:uncharacterized protein n=1 Tax=Durotheca rogersii TaxID=419775 RepID=UPI00222103B6|nr:uncharacterized protein GGS23DRAFT_593248 [Durotheca rogersii]KAI5866501.1 hypothetical protein GGS23DRAFT_593248 [Durotheca rogersii]